MQVKIQCFLQYKTSLWHRAFKRIDQQQDAISHFQNALHLTAKIGVTRCIDHIYLNAFIGNGDVLCQNGNTTFPLKVIAVHDKVACFLVVAEYVGSMQYLIDQCRLTVVNVRNDGDVTNVHKMFTFNTLAV